MPKLKVLDSCHMYVYLYNTMSLSTKIFVTLLFASAVGLNSCVNEVNPDKNFPSDTSSVPIDTNFLHGFKNISLTFSGRCQYNYVSIPMQPDTILRASYKTINSLIRYTIDWTGKYCKLSANMDTGFSHGPDSNGLGYAGTNKNIINMECYISGGGKQIDSGKFSSYSYEYWISTHTYNYRSKSTLLRYQFLPQMSITDDSIVYSFSGDQLQANVKEIRDSSIDIMSTYPIPRTGVKYRDGLKEMLWDKQPLPILTIKFTK